MVEEYAKASEKATVAKNATPALARADLGVDKSYVGKYNRKKFSFIHKNFPGEQVSGSETHRLAVWWASKKSVKAGDQTLISMNDTWYIVEKFDDADNHYQLEDRITKAEFETISREIKQYGRSRQIKSVSWGVDGIDKLYKQRSSIKGGKSSADSNKTQYGGQDNQVQRLGKNEIEGRERPTNNGRGNSKSGGQNRQGRASLDIDEIFESLTAEEFIDLVNSDSSINDIS